MAFGVWNSSLNRAIPYWGGPVATHLLKSVSVGERTMHYSVHADPEHLDVPIMLYFHSWSGTPRQETHIDEAAKRMIVVQPWDNFGFNRQGCWWLGEGGDFFMPSLLDALIEDVRRQFPNSTSIHTCGRSMGGFGALFHGLRLSAKSVYAEIPQVMLYEKYKDLTMFPPFIENIFGYHGEHEYGNLIELYRKAEIIPDRINIVHNHWDDSFESHDAFVQMMGLINLFVERKADFYLEVPPMTGHTYMNPLPIITDLLLA